MFRFIRKLTVVEWLVIATITIILGAIVNDEIRGHLAERQATSDAERDIAVGDFAFHVGGRRRLWFDETAAIFRARYDWRHPLR